MDFSWQEEDELLRDTVRRYATERLAPDYARWESEPFPRERVKELGDLVVSGEKASCTFAGSADACVVFARTGGPGAAGISMVLVPLDRPGVSRQVYDSVGGKLSQRGSLFFDDVRVPAANQLGAEGAGFVGAMQGFDFNRSIIAREAFGREFAAYK